MKIRLGLFAALFGLGASAAQAVPLDYILFQDTSTTNRGWGETR